MWGGGEEGWFRSARNKRKESERWCEEEEEEEFLRADTAGIIENIFASFHRPFPCVSSFDRVTR